MRVQDRTPERLGPYRLVDKLGEGGMGVVYLASDASGQPVAVKALRSTVAQEENARRRLAREVATMRMVRSPHVAEVSDADLDGEPPYIVTRYVPGRTLDAVVDADGPLTGSALARLARGLAEALAAVHAAGVVHRDLKPGNVMLTDGDPVVIDFGIAQIAESTRLTMTGMFMGTPGYLAPEVIEGNPSSSRSDVHSWGATLAFAATGRPPFGTGPFEGIFYRIVQGHPDLDTLPASLRPVVLRAMSRDPADRPDAAELVRLADALDPRSLVPSPSSGAGPRAGAGPAVPSGTQPRTVADQAGPAVQPNPTRPLIEREPTDLRDLLPPVNYAPPEYFGPAADDAAAGAWPPAEGRPGQWPDDRWLSGPLAAGADDGASAATDSAGSVRQWWPGTPSWRGSETDLSGEGTSGAGRVPARPPAAARQVNPWSPLVIAATAVLVAGSVVAPVGGTAIVLILLIILRAGGITAGQVARRRERNGSRGAVMVGVLLYPVALVRALLKLVLLAPVALLGFMVAAGIVVMAVPVHPLPQALALGAGTMVAIIGLGPGSGGGRQTLAAMFTAVTGTPALRAVSYFGMLALAAWAAATAWSLPAVFWPLSHLHAQLAHLPGVRAVLTDIRLSLLGIARHFGL